MEEGFRRSLNDSSLIIMTSPAWGSQNPQHRELIYSALDQKLAQGKFYYSISHAPDMGGFAISENPIGFDIESSSRVTEPVIRRVSKDFEMSTAPDFASLWCAKEASFKALKNFDQPKVVSQIEIEFKKGSNTPIRFFNLVNEKKFTTFRGIGGALTLSEFTYCILIFRP